ncbi:hypothetical protein BDZ94DRAFT_899146 [Collybia nuda]|uniref:Uncharacterized protein n=1 Tax=Collybia nuda TaxID=64659 RepID=A0A9P5XSY8_9AGAR|nr:hypothetical protein BDZ94DRAFT_899146 [Collybia nuda]
MNEGANGEGGEEANGGADEDLDDAAGEDADAEEMRDRTNDEGLDTGSEIDDEENSDESDQNDDDMRLVAPKDVDELFQNVPGQEHQIKKEVIAKPLAKGKAKKVEESQAQEKVKSLQRVTMRIKWDQMTEEEQDTKQESAKREVHAFLRNPSTHRIPVNTRAMIREVAEFCIPACQSTRELALHVLENKYHNLLCVYHQKMDKTGKIHDRGRRGGFRVTGTPFSRLVNEKPKKNETASVRKERRPGYLHCGCPEDEALLELYWWKLAEATSPTTDETEGWLDHRKMDPRTRTLMFAFFTSWTHMDVEDIYAGYPVKSSFDVRMQRYDTKIAQLQEAKAGEVEEEARRVKEEEEKRAKRDRGVAAKKATHKGEKYNKMHHKI